jgi:2Fe-2S ferredoxin
MGGSNPYIEEVEFESPSQPYKLTFITDDGEQEILVEPDKFPYDHNGLTGSILDILLGHDAPIDHACGGVCACSTCHVYVEKGAKSCNEANENEEDMIDDARSVKPNSRLACQCVPNGSEPVTVRMPGWNRNLIKEDH